MRFDTAQADRITALVLFALGIALFWAGYTMDRLEVRRIHPASIPGLVPMILGVALPLCAIPLYLGARDAEEPAPPASWRDLGLAGGWSIAYALAMIGTVPFYAATAIYVAGFVTIFDRDRPPLRRVLLAVPFGLMAAGAIGALFRYAFLVRLP